jgi:hypothetical protein
MRKMLLTLFVMLLLTQPAAAQESQGPASSCAASGNGAVGYVQRGDDIILMECPAMEGNATCTCHEPPGQDGACRVYACNADGSPKEAEAHPAPPAPQMEKASSAAKPDVSAQIKPHSAKKKAKKQSEAPSPLVTVIEEKKTEVLPAQNPPHVAPAPASNKIEYSR